MIDRPIDERDQQSITEETSCTDSISSTKGVDATSLSTGKTDLLFENIVAMKLAENSSYSYRSYLKRDDNNSVELPIWRGNICNWKYSVIDHFRLLSRRTVAVSMNIFDRVLATKGSQYGRKDILLLSLGALYISIKIHEQTGIELCTMSDLSRHQFSSKEIQEAELNILQNTRWLVHPPLPIDFISLLLKVLPTSVIMPVRYKIFESARYLVELSVCDHFFVGLQASIIAFAALLNVLDDEIGYHIIPENTVQLFLANLRLNFQFDPDQHRVGAVRYRLRGLIPTPSRTSPRTICRDV